MTSPSPLPRGPTPCIRPTGALRPQTAQRPKPRRRLWPRPRQPLSRPVPTRAGSVHAIVRQPRRRSCPLQKLWQEMHPCGRHRSVNVAARAAARVAGCHHRVRVSNAGSECLAQSFEAPTRIGSNHARHQLAASSTRTSIAPSIIRRRHCRVLLVTTTRRPRLASAREIEGHRESSRRWRCRRHCHHRRCRALADLRSRCRLRSGLQELRTSANAL